MENQFIAIDPQKIFCFDCSSDNVCFNACCRNLNQCLTPFDFLMLKKFLGLPSTQCLETYTVQSTGPATGLPVVSIKPDYKDHLKCPFVTPKGCSIYPARPASCRIYPLARAVTRSRETGERKEHWALIREAHCKGFDSNKKQTITRWIRNQDLKEYNEMNDLMVELIALKNQRGKAPLTLFETKMFHMALYDLDTFRSHVFEKNLLDKRAAGEKMIQQARSSDKALLKLGMAWIKSELFTAS